MIKCTCNKSGGFFVRVSYFFLDKSGRDEALSRINVFVTWRPHTDRLILRVHARYGDLPLLRLNASNDCSCDSIKP